MKQYTIQITDKALADMEEIYAYIVRQLLSPESALGQYNRMISGSKGHTDSSCLHVRGCMHLDQPFYECKTPNGLALKKSRRRKNGRVFFNI